MAAYCDTNFSGALISKPPSSPSSKDLGRFERSGQPGREAHPALFVIVPIGVSAGWWGAIAERVAEEAGSSPHVPNAGGELGNLTGTVLVEVYDLDP